MPPNLLGLWERHLKLDATAATFRFAFIGDSENDASCFAAFHHSFGVANLRGRPSLLPRYRASLPKSRGFIEIADALLAARAESSLGSTRQP